MKELYILRHGETEFNKLKIVQGRGVNEGLNGKGNQQAALFYEHYKYLPFEKVYTSTLKRTHETVKNFISNGISHESLPGLDEISWGDFEGVKGDDKFHRSYLELLEAWNKGDLNAKINNGESPLEVAERQIAAIDYITKANSERKLLICMHGRAMRILLAKLIYNDLRRMEEFEHTNTGLYKIVFDNDKFFIEIRNSVEHLKLL